MSNALLSSLIIILVLCVCFIVSKHNHKKLHSSAPGQDFLIWLSQGGANFKPNNSNTFTYMGDTLIHDAPPKAHTGKFHEEYIDKTMLTRLKSKVKTLRWDNEEKNDTTESTFNFGSALLDNNLYWWNGPNVCVDREEATEYDDKVQTLNNIYKLGDEGDDHMSMTTEATIKLDLFATKSMTSCWEVWEKYECMTHTSSRGILKTYTTTYKCCYGYQRDKKRLGCTKSDLNDVMKTIRDIEANEFLSLITNEKLYQRIKNNSTWFVPLDKAMSKFVDQIADLIPAEKRDRKRIQRSLGSAFSTKDLALNHVIPKFVNINNIDNNAIFNTYLRGSIIRTNVFTLTAGNTLITLNCVAVRRANVHATNGLIHIVDSIIPPATNVIKDVIGRSVRTRLFSKLMRNRNMARILERREPYTLLVPTDNTFLKLDISVRRILQSGNACAQAILRNHIIPHIVCTTAILSETVVKTLEGYTYKLVRKENDRILIDSKYEIMRPDNMATNGVIQMIEGYLLPDTGLHVMEIMAKYNFTKFSKVVRSFEGLDMKWNSYVNKTFFVPSNKAFEDGLLEKLEVNAGDDSYITLFDFYMSPTMIFSKDFINNKLIETELEEKGRINLYSTIEIYNQTEIKVNVATYSCARISRVDIRCCGAVVHVIDRMIMPATKTIYDVIADDISHILLKQIIDGTEVEDILKNETLSITFLAPTDEALSQLNNRDMKVLVEDKDKASEVLLNHILKEVMCCAGIETTPWDFNILVQTMSGTPKEVGRTKRHRVRIGIATVVHCDIPATNGVIHRVNRLLLPVKPGYQFNDIGLFVFDI